MKVKPWHLALGAVVVYVAFFRKGKAATGTASMSRYFRVNGKCMVKPYDDVPAYQIPCDQWEREREQEQKGALGYEVKG